MSKFDIKNFKPGLIIEKNKRSLLGAAPSSYRTPLHLDHRYELLSTNNQFNSQSCVGQTTAGYIEGNRWSRDGIYEQIDGFKIYEEAKKLDNLSQEGTTLEAGLAAAEKLGLITNIQQQSIRAIDKFDEVCRALHKYKFLIGAFDITRNWTTDSSGWINFDPTNTFLGGHASLLCGYSKITKNNKGQIIPFVTIQGSWGETQAWHGFSRLTLEAFNQCFQYALVFDSDFNKV